MIKKKAKAKSGRAGGSSGFKYRPRTAEDVEARAERKGGAKFDSIFKQGFDSWRPKDGENVIRILPPTWEEHDHYGYDIQVHAFVGPDESNYLCLKMQGKRCPICDAAREAQRAGEEDEYKKLRAKTQVVAWVVDRDDEKQTPSLYAMSFTMDKDIAALCHNKRTGKVLLIDHPDEGYDVSFTRTGKKLNTRYIGVQVDRQPSPILSDEEEQERLLEYIQENPVPSVLNFYDEDYLARMIEGTAGERDEELDEDQAEDEEGERAPRKKPAVSARGTTRRRAEPEDEEEEVDEDVEEADDEEEEEEERLARKGAAPARGKNRRVEEDEEDEVDDGEEEVDAEEDEEEVDEEEVDEEEDDEDAPPPKKPVGKKPAPRAGRR